MRDSDIQEFIDANTPTVRASQVWNGQDALTVPAVMGAPLPHQMQGSVAERLSELAGRCCYDSVGDPESRSSQDYHKHILEVGHGSILEHFNWTMQFVFRDVVAAALFSLHLHNRPGTWVVFEQDQTTFTVRLTLNLRCAVEWDRWRCELPDAFLDGTKEWLSMVVRASLTRVAPYIASLLPPISTVSAPASSRMVTWEPVVPAKYHEEQWIALYMSSSRGWSHEQVRHKFRTAVSQRCIAGDSVITVAHKSGHAQPKSNGGGHRTIKWLYDRMQDPRLAACVRKLRPRVLDEQTGLFTSGRLLDVLYTGKKECFAVTLKNGQSITCTKDHRIYTASGWKTLKEIADPRLTEGDVVVWNKEAAIKIACNGIAVAGKGLYHDKEWLETRYKKENADLAEMALESECSTHVIRKWLKRFSLQKRMDEINANREPWNKGLNYSHTKPYSQETIQRYRDSKLGSKNPQWKGGRGSAARRAFHAWKRHNAKQVFERDGWRCRLCSRHTSEVKVNSKHMRKRTIEIHHILPLWNRPDLACEINNMASVCWECQSSKLNGHEFDYANALLDAVKSPLVFARNNTTKPHGKRVVKAHFVKIAAITYAGEIDTYDLVLDGPNHGFVANGVVVHNSTRYVDEDGSKQSLHPAIFAYLKDNKADTIGTGVLKRVIEDAQHTGRVAYGVLVSALTPWLTKRLKGDKYAKTTARKQARGAARGLLGNALVTEMIFSASVAQWRRMYPMRCSNAADAEINEVFVAALPELQRTPYHASFDDLKLTYRGDGLGQCLADGGLK